MQRSQSHRQVAKKVGIPEVPDMTSPLPPATGTPKRTSATSSYGSLGQLTEEGQHTPSSSAQQQGSPGTPEPHSECLPTPHRHKGRIRSPGRSTSSFACSSVYDVIVEEGMTTSMPSPRHRNSTGSNSSQGSSGFESMRSHASPAVMNQQVATLRGESPPSRNSYHSSGSSSLGSLERLDEGGGQPVVNVHEMLLHGVPDHEILQAWLSSLHYEEYIPLFLNAGYDLATVTRMTPEDLTAIGITKPGHRKRLTTEIHRMGTVDNLPHYKPASLREWLCLLRLGEYTPLFEAQGYRSVADVAKLTWEDFGDLGLTRLGHLKKLSLAIKRLKELKPTPQQQQQSHPGIVVYGQHHPPSGYQNGYHPHQHHPPQNGYHHTTNGFHNGGALPQNGEMVQVIQVGPQGQQRLAAEVRPYSHFPDGQDPYGTFNGSGNDFLSVSVDGYPQEAIYQERYAPPAYNTYPFGHQNGDATPPAKPKLTVKPRPVAKIVAKTKRSDGEDIPQDVVYLDPPLKKGGSCAPTVVYSGEQSAIYAGHGGMMTGYAHASVIVQQPNSSSLQRYHSQPHHHEGGYPPDLAAVYESPGTAAHYASPVRRLRSVPNAQPLDIIHCSPAHYRNGGLSSNGGPPRCLPLLPSHHFTGVQSDSELLCNGNGQGCVPNNKCYGSRNSVDGTETGSLSEFPPPPSPLTCEDSINTLKTIRQSSTEPEGGSGTPFRSGTLSKGGSVSSPSTPTMPSKIPRHNSTGDRPPGLPHPDRNNSSTSIDSSSSADTLPFANENCGTIRSIKNGGGRPDPPHLQSIFNNSPTPPQPAPSGSQSARIPSSIPPVKYSSSAPQGPDVLDEIGNMLQGLTDELDALLTDRPPALTAK